jgi:hypothetical protein
MKYVVILVACPYSRCCLTLLTSATTELPDHIEVATGLGQNPRLGCNLPRAIQASPAKHWSPLAGARTCNNTTSVRFISPCRRSCCCLAGSPSAFGTCQSSGGDLALEWLLSSLMIFYTRYMHFVSPPPVLKKGKRKSLKKGKTKGHGLVMHLPHLSSPVCTWALFFSEDTLSICFIKKIEYKLQHKLTLRRNLT